jgi:hypothetical protein
MSHTVVWIVMLRSNILRPSLESKDKLRKKAIRSGKQGSA